MRALQLSAVLIVGLAVATSAFCAGYKVVRVIEGDTIVGFQNKWTSIFTFIEEIEGDLSYLKGSASLAI